MIESHAPIFIVGRPRSGTTLMASILDAHPRLSILPIETEIFSLWYAKYLEFSPRNPEDLERFWSLFASKRFRKLEMDRAEILPSVNHYDPLTILKCILTKAGEIDAQRLNKSRWGEKTPIHYKSLKLIFNAYPEAQVIMMLRDPRGILASLLKTPWNKESTEASARNWNEFVYFMRRWSSDPRVRMVRYEQLALEPEATLQDVCRWLGEEYTPAMLDRSHLTHRLVTKKGWGLEHRRKALEPINVSGLEKWKNELTPRQIRLTEHCCATVMREMGYETQTRGPAFPTRLIINIKNRLRHPKIYFRAILKVLIRGKSAMDKILNQT